jgi:hypothetical protein
MSAHRRGLSSTCHVRRCGSCTRLVPAVALLVLAALAALALVPPVSQAVAPRDAGGAISGTVTGGDNVGIGGIEVTAYAAGSAVALPSVATASDGTYTVSGLTSGSYRLRFFDPSGRFVTEFYNNKPTILTANIVGVTDGVTTVGVNAQLASFGSLGGVIKSAAGKALAGIEVNTWSFDGINGWQWAGGAVTDTAGKYTIGGLAPGDYRVGFADPNGQYLGEFYDNARSLARAKDVTVLAGRITVNVDARLDIPGSILGTVTSAGGGGVSGVIVTVFLGNASGGWEAVGSTVTRGSGGYLVEDLPAGRCRVKFEDPTKQYLTQFYLNSTSLTGGTDVVVTPGKASVGVDARLVAAASVGGKVMRPNGSALSGIHVYALRKTSAGWLTVGSAVSSLSGTYVIGSLRAGTYRVKFADPSGVWVTEYWDDQLLPDQAKAVVLQAGDARRGLSARMALAGGVGGAAKDAAGRVLAGIMVAAFRQSGSSWVWAGSARTSATGTYRVAGLAAGTYRMRFADPTGKYATLYFRSASSLAAATNVSVVSGATTWRISAVMKVRS